jgi:hypothetical protein
VNAPALSSIFLMLTAAFMIMNIGARSHVQAKSEAAVSDRQSAAAAAAMMTATNLCTVCGFAIQ